MNIIATKNYFPIEEIGANNPRFYNRIRTTIETAFYRNNVIEVKSLEEAYLYAKNSPGTIVLDQEVYNAEKLGLPKGAKVLLFNDGNITGRQAKLRKLVNDENSDQYSNLLREVIFASRNKKMYYAKTYVGLDRDFMVKAHLLISEGYENTLYSWLLNFQLVNDEYTKLYNESKILDEGDIYLYSDPDMYPDEYPDGLALFDSNHNCGCLLGLRYFGEHKKGTLTLAWSIAQRNGFTACHGGQKRFNFNEKTPKVISVFGLSGSGKSTITLSNHENKYDITVLHDDAFIISNQDASSICLEQSYFDKTQDYPLTIADAKYFVTIQNCGVSIDSKGRKIPVTEDVRNGNGRTVKSLFAAKNREYKISHPCDAIFWIMKDDILPPVLKIKSPQLGSVMGATLATMRSTAEFVNKEEYKKLVYVPYANPFRLYPLANDYNKFKQLFEDLNIDCYIINTGYFLNKKITPKVTLGLIEDIVNEDINFIKFGPLNDIDYSPIIGFEPNLSDNNYLEILKFRMLDRLNYVEKLDEFDKLPTEAINAIKKVIDELNI